MKDKKKPEDIKIELFSLFFFFTLFYFWISSDVNEDVGARSINQNHLRNLISPSA